MKLIDKAKDLAARAEQNAQDGDTAVAGVQAEIALVYASLAAIDPAGDVAGDDTPPPAPEPLPALPGLSAPGTDPVIVQPAPEATNEEGVAGSEGDLSPVETGLTPPPAPEDPEGEGAKAPGESGGQGAEDGSTPPPPPPAE